MRHKTDEKKRPSESVDVSGQQATRMSLKTLNCDLHEMKGRDEDIGDLNRKVQN
jgi:hypothetical protein